MKIFVINGPNLDFLGIREPEIYGSETYDDLVAYLSAAAVELGITLSVFQSNHEGAMIDEIHRAYYEKADGLILNAGGYTHTSIALMDAVRAVSIPTVEVHLSNPDTREEFRYNSYIARVAVGRCVGHGFLGYREAMELLLRRAENAK